MTKCPFLNVWRNVLFLLCDQMGIFLLCEGILPYSTFRHFVIIFDRSDHFYLIDRTEYFLLLTDMSNFEWFYEREMRDYSNPRLIPLIYPLKVLTASKSISKLIGSIRIWGGSRGIIGNNWRSSRWVLLLSVLVFIIVVVVVVTMFMVFFFSSFVRVIIPSEMNEVVFFCVFLYFFLCFFCIFFVFSVFSCVFYCIFVFSCIFCVFCIFLCFLVFFLCFFFSVFSCILSNFVFSCVFESHIYFKKYITLKAP